MSKVSRRGFLGKTTMGAATVGAMVALPSLASVTDADAAPISGLSNKEFNGPLVAHVRNMKTGEISLMFGTREVVIHDRKLAARLADAAR